MQFILLRTICVIVVALPYHLTELYTFYVNMRNTFELYIVLRIAAICHTLHFTSSFHSLVFNMQLEHELESVKLSSSNMLGQFT